MEIIEDKEYKNYEEYKIPSEIKIKSPDGTIYIITVGDTGKLQITQQL